LSNAPRRVFTPHPAHLHQNFIEMELRKCCNHPFLLRGVDEREVGNMTTLAQRREHLIRCSGKMVFLDKLLTKLKSQGKKVRVRPAHCCYGLAYLLDSW
jgi:SNF2 family DNA or RNA helicase